MTSQRTPEQWGDEYRRTQPTYQRFCEEFERLIRDLLSGADIDFAQIEPRTKSVESFVDKIRRKNEKYVDPIHDMTDLAGLRVIAYFPADVIRIGALVEEHFDVDWDNSRRQSGATDPDRFGYRSDHYVVRFSAARLALPENVRFADHVAEIQVRTVMQHAWAAVDHRLRYKNTTQLPQELRRRLSRLSALLEVADDQFAAVKQAADELETTYADEVQRGDLSAHVDALSLEAFIEPSGLATLWAGRALEHGFAPAAHEEKDLTDLVNALRDVDARTLADVAGFYARAEAWGDSFLREVAARSTAAGFAPVAVPYDVLTFLAFGAAPTDDVLFAADYAKPIADAIASLSPTVEPQP